NLHVGEMIWRETKARSPVVRNINGPACHIEDRWQRPMLLAHWQILVHRREAVHYLLLALGFFSSAELSQTLRPMRNGFMNDLIHPLHLVDSHERIDFGQELRQFLPKPLRQTARNNQSLPA